jgi:3D (Asp-Asp-Asp) domain-containing protein
MNQHCGLPHAPSRTVLKRLLPLRLSAVLLPAILLAGLLTAAMPSDTQEVSEAPEINVAEILSETLSQQEDLADPATPAVANITTDCAVTVTCDGVSQTIFVSDGTVGQVLSRLGISVGQYDALSPTAATPITGDSMTIQLERAVVYQETQYVDIPYDTVRTPDNNLPEGTEKVTRAGETGVQANEVQVVIRPGQEAEYMTLSTSVVSEPVSEQVVYGTYVPGTLVTASGERISYSKVLTCTATAYTDYSGNPTATGTTPRVGAIAVDPKVIPYGTRMYIVTSDGSIIYGYATAEDCGSAIKGNRVDLYYNSESECVQFGRRSVQVYILN